MILWQPYWDGEISSQMIYLGIYHHICIFSNRGGDFIDSVDPQKNSSPPQGLHQQQKSLKMSTNFANKNIYTSYFNLGYARIKFRIVKLKQNIICQEAMLYALFTF